MNFEVRIDRITRASLLSIFGRGVAECVAITISINLAVSFRAKCNAYCQSCHARQVNVRIVSSLQGCEHGLEGPNRVEMKGLIE